MNHALRWATRLALFLTALFVLGTGVAGAQESETVAVDLPIDLCGVGVGLLGDSSADCAGTAAPAAEPAPEPAAVDPAVSEEPPAGDTVLGDVGVDVDAPIGVCGLGIGSTAS
ncbi:MAG: hypothetical protein ACYC2O_02830, partial [Microthrixaceae bacterium]